MPLTSAYWSNGRAPRGGPAVARAPAPAPDPVLPAVPASEDAAASLGEIQAALLQPGGGVIQQRRTPVVDAGDAYKPGYESVVAHAKASSSSRLARIQQVREQERLWARFQAREFRAAVKEHHDELTNQLHQGWLKARALKQQELERDYSGAVVGVGRAQRDAAAMGNATAKKQRARELAIEKFDADLSALERHETALAKEFERLDETEAPYFVAADRRVTARALADKTREDMRAKAAAFADSEEGRRKKLVESLIAETDARIARPTRRGRAMAAATFKDTHFNDLVVDSATGIAVGVRRARKGAGHADTSRVSLAPAAAAVEVDGVAAVERNDARKTSSAAVSAFDAAFEQERVRAERRDEELRALRAKKAKEASRANFAAQRARAVASKREMAAKMDEEARADRARKVREMAAGGGLINAPLLRKWNEKKRTEDTLRAFETAFSEISRAGGSSGGGGGGGGGGAPGADTFDDERPFDDDAPSSPPGGGFDTLFEASEEEKRLGDLGLETVLAMARGAQTPVEERIRRADAPEALARRGVAGATMSEIAAVVRAGERAVPSPRRPYDTSPATYDSDGSDDDFVGPAGGAGLPLSSFVDEAQLDAAVAAAAEHGRRAALAAASPLDPAGAASASAARLSAVARSLEADTSELSGSRSLNLSEDTTHLFSNTMDDVTAASLTEADAAPSTAPAPSTLPGSSSSGDAEAEMRASLAATAAAMDRVTQEAEAAEAVLAAAARRAAVRPASAFDETAEDQSDRGLPGRVEVPALKPLDAILGALGEQVRALDAAAAEASARAPESQFGSSSSGGGSSGDANVANVSATQDDSALYAAAAAAANDSAPPSSYDARSFGEVSAHRSAPSTPGDGNLFASPAGAPAETPQSADAPPYGLRPQRDALGGYGANAVDVAAVAARIAAAAVADAAPGEAPDATARRVASAMEAALGGAFKKREISRASRGLSASSSPARSRDGSLGMALDASANADSSWAQALGALEGEWAASLNLSRAQEKSLDVSSATRETPSASPSRFAGVASRDADDAFAAAEAAAEAAVRAETETVNGTVSIAAPLRVGATSGVDFSDRVWRSEPFADDWSDAATAGDASEGIGDRSRSARTLGGTVTGVVSGVSVDGRSLAALANALDERSLDADRSFDDASSFGEAEAATAEEDGARRASAFLFATDPARAVAGVSPDESVSATKHLRKKPSEEEEAKAASRRAEAAALRKKARDADKKRREAFSRRTAAKKEKKRAEAAFSAPSSADPGPAAKASARVVSSRRR